MSGAWDRSPEGKYPESLSECFEQGEKDFINGLSMFWTPNLGPLSGNLKACKAWREGWLHQRDELLDKWMEEAGRVAKLHEDPEGDAEGGSAEGSGG